MTRGPDLHAPAPKRKNDRIDPDNPFAQALAGLKKRPLTPGGKMSVAKAQGMDANQAVSNGIVGIFDDFFWVRADQDILLNQARLRRWRAGVWHVTLGFDAGRETFQPGRASGIVPLRRRTPIRDARTFNQGLHRRSCQNGRLSAISVRFRTWLVLLIAEATIQACIGLGSTRLASCLRAKTPLLLSAMRPRICPTMWSTRTF